MKLSTLCKKYQKYEGKVYLVISDIITELQKFSNFEINVVETTDGLCILYEDSEIFAVNYPLQLAIEAIKKNGILTLTDIKRWG